MFTSASCVQLRRQPNAMDWKKMSSTTPKNNIGAYKRSPFNQQTENRDKDKQSAEDAKGTSKKTSW